MAKIGNETKLVLKLAEERTNKIREKVEKSGRFNGMEIDKVGFHTGVHEALSILREIVQELESGK